jgi:acetyltransferase
MGATHSREHFQALFDPKGIIVAGASTHPGKFGFVALHNILAAGYAGKVFATNLEGTPVLGIDTVASVDDLPAGEADLVFVCTPAKTNIGLLQQCAAKGVKSAFITSAGYGEAGEEGIAAQAALVAECERLGILMVGPNGQGVISTPSSMCAQIVAPMPPRGTIGIASQSGNFVSSFENYARHYGVGISRAVSAGNAAATGVVDFLEFYADDPETTVGLAYVEGIIDGRGFFERIRKVAERMPLVLVKGGASDVGSRAAASHTGSLATNDRVFDGMCRQAGVVRAATIEEAYEAAATFATQPLPTGSNVAVVTTAGGWGVVTADAISTAPGLNLMPLPDDLRAALDEHLPPRWSRNNPIDLAGGETKDTIPTILQITAEHPAVDAIVLLGMGIQGNQGRMEKDGRFYPGHGLERIVGYHERQDHRFTSTAAEISKAVGKPILAATELSIADPTNPAVAGCRDAGVLCYGSANRAVTALSHLAMRAAWHQKRSL